MIDIVGASSSQDGDEHLFVLLCGDVEQFNTYLDLLHPGDWFDVPPPHGLSTRVSDIKYYTPSSPRSLAGIAFALVKQAWIEFAGLRGHTINDALAYKLVQHYRMWRWPEYCRRRRRRDQGDKSR